MRKLIIENQYFPTLLFYSLILRIEDVYIESQEHFVKRSFRNRLHIPGPNGVQALTIPLEGGKSKTAIRDVKISYAEDWQKNHWHTIQTIYKNAPYFEHFEEGLKLIYTDRYETLFDCINTIHQFVFKALKVEKKLQYTSAYITEYDETAYIDARNKLLPSEILVEGFEHKPYRQIFQDKIGFQANMSILDALMCLGPDAIDIL